jgi:hypothetical protein
MRQGTKNVDNLGSLAKNGRVCSSRKSLGRARAGQLIPTNNNDSSARVHVSARGSPDAKDGYPACADL